MDAIASSEPTIPPPRRGRPPRLSREAIVVAVAEMLLADPAAPLTIARAADAVGAAPMSLYRHVRDRQDLVDAVTQHLFSSARPRPTPGTPWQEDLASWMRGTYALAMRVPQLVRMIASGESAAWLHDSAQLADVLRRAGITDDAALGDAVYWVATTTMGQAMIHAAATGEPAAEALQRALDELDEEEALRVERLLPAFASRADAFDRVVDRTIRSIEAELPRR